MRRASRFAAGLGSFFEQVRAARACASAMEAGRRPPERAIRTLGLNPDTFDRFA
ncbi:hypothetical protein [Jiella marina]|uniref:hypothetical protein n=1 Tax=Jiella sp. LLJ827 TaxID=2917712 RepID=UPI0021017BA3|nr:hypothetical protein [Jiella sp. LLJ827]MCQ0990579.1 hypothetical protein [Jiella sp. LLJ827]